MRIVTKFFPSPSISFIQPPPHGPELSRISVTNTSDEQSNYSSNKEAACIHLKDIHMSRRLMEDFVDAARENTNKDLETCGVLGAFFKDGAFYVTTLIIPKQEATSSSVRTLIFSVSGSKRGGDLCHSK